MLYRRPVLFHPFKHCLRSDAVCNVGRRQIDKQKSTIRINGNMSFSTDNFLVTVYAAFLCLRSLDALAVQYGKGGELLLSASEPVKHNADIQDG